MTFTHDTFLSPFTWRYGSDEMRCIWSETNKRRIWRQIWVALASAQCKAGLVTVDQVADLREHVDDVDIDRAHQIESEIHHDLMAEIRTFAEQCPIGGGIIHLGATSMDIEDNAEVLRIREALDVIIDRLGALLRVLAETIEREADHVCMAFTHIQPAEPTTVGYRLAMYAQDLLADYESLLRVRQQLRGKGLKGAVGTAASYAQLLNGTGMTPAHMDKLVMDALGLEAFVIATQTYTRRQDWTVLTVLAGVGMTVYKLAYDLRILQTPSIGEWAEPFGISQVGSSAMPFKRNPIHAENIDSMARYLATLPRVAWDNGAHNLLERTLDDSGNRRVILPEAFLTTEEILRRALRIVKGLRLNNQAIRHNLDVYGTFAATERVLMEAVRVGGNRQVLHEVIRKHSLAAWDALQQGQPNPLIDSLSADSQLRERLTDSEIRDLLQVDSYVGDAPERARLIVTEIGDKLPVA